MWSPCIPWAHWSHMAGYILNVISICPLGTLYSHHLVHSEYVWSLPTGHIVIAYWLDSQCIQHVPTDYWGPCPQCKHNQPSSLWGTERSICNVGKAGSSPQHPWHLTTPEPHHHLPPDLPPRSQPACSPLADTGGKGVITQWVHGEFIVSFETICLVSTHQVCVEYF